MAIGAAFPPLTTMLPPFGISLPLVAALMVIPVPEETVAVAIVGLLELLRPPSVEVVVTAALVSRMGVLAEIVESLGVVRTALGGEITTFIDRVVEGVEVVVVAAAVADEGREPLPPGR